MLFSRPVLILFVHFQYNSRSKEDRASLDVIIKGALQHAKVSNSVLSQSV